MSVQSIWENEGRTILTFEFVEPWTWDEYEEAAKMGNEMLSSVSHKVDVIVDFSASGPIPNGALNYFRTGAKKPHPNTDMIAVVGANRMIQMVGGLLESMFPKSLKGTKFYDTRAEAINYIESR